MSFRFLSAVMHTWWHQMNWSCFFLFTLTNSNLYQHVYFAGKNLRYEGDTLCYVFPWGKLGWLWINTGLIRSKFSVTEQIIHHYCESIKLHHILSLSSASFLLLIHDAAEDLLMRKWFKWYVFSASRSSILLPPALISVSYVVVRFDLSKLVTQAIWVPVFVNT